MLNQEIVPKSKISEIPPYGLRAYALFFLRHGANEGFSQNELDWIIGQSMKKKIFSLLLKAGWIIKSSRKSYLCVSPQQIFRRILEFKVPEILKQAEKEYAFTGLSAVEIWSDYSYVQRSIDKSPYFIQVLRKDLNYWKNFFNMHRIPRYIKAGATIGEYVILIPVKKIVSVKKNNLNVQGLKETMEIARLNSQYLYAYEYIIQKYGGKYG